ncbi:MAG: tetratricopeptide repeat protein [Flavobacteriaceae bacterium]|nr:tetratricopeptide repeat protein [Flavobacteriaceae bacterium]
MNTRIIFFLFLFGILQFPNSTYAQKLGDPVTEDLGNVTDEFQEYFFEALKQKGIENYELAIEALRKAEKAAGENEENKAVVYFEMGKNLSKLKRYEDAEINYNKVLAWDHERIEVMEAMYDLYYESRNYDAAIPLVKKLIKQDSDYKEDLANLYNRTKQYDKALELLDELDEEWGESNYRNALRNQIYRVTGNTSEAINKLEEKIDKNPKSEQEYLNLIFLYSDEGNSKKAFETAKVLLKQKPNSKLVHLALYKYFLEEDNINDAVNSMNIVFSSEEIEKESKIKVLEDFLISTKKNPSFKLEIKSVIPSVLSDDDGHIYMLLGDYYISEGNKEEALQYYLNGIEKDPDNYGLLKNTILLQIEVEQYQQASDLSIQGIEIFPAQSLLYLTNGVANNHLNNADIAIETLEEGLDYLFDNLKMEYDFYQQLSIAYQLKGNNKKVKIYNKKASEVSISNQKTDN